MRWEGHLIVGMDCVYFLMILNVFLGTFTMSRSSNCFVAECSDRCLLTFNAENWDYINIADWMIVW